MDDTISTWCEICECPKKIPLSCKAVKSKFVVTKRVHSVGLISLSLNWVVLNNEEEKNIDQNPNKEFLEKYVLSKKIFFLKLTN